MKSEKIAGMLDKSNVAKIQPALSSAITKRYGESNAKSEAAIRAKYFASEYLFNRPIGMAPNFRMSDLQNEMKEYIQKRFEEDSEAKGFLFGGEIILGYVISAIISFIIKIILEKLMDSYQSE